MGARCPTVPSRNFLAAKLLAARAAEGAEIAIAASGGRTHPVVGLWPVALAVELRQVLVEEGLRKVEMDDLGTLLQD